MYKVCLVEDEIVTREGIRDNVDWATYGFEFCGEAPDGEIALNLLQTEKPDVLITDIKMPFVDGLQLCRIVRERMPWMRIIILSGHDEFKYAQEAIKLGVSEYLLKPVTVNDLNQVLKKVAALLDHERDEQRVLEQLQTEVEENQVILRERLLLKLVVGAISSTEALEKSQELGLDLVARHYLVVIIKLELTDRSDQFDYDEYQSIQEIVPCLVENNPDIFLLKKDWEEQVLLMKGDTLDYLEEERNHFLNLVKKELEQTRYRLTIGLGSTKNRISDIYQSFGEALISMQNASESNRQEIHETMDRAELLKMDRTAVENYLHCGNEEEFDSFFDSCILPLGESALKSQLIKNYIIVDSVLATAKTVNELGGEVDEVVPELNSIGNVMTEIKTLEELREKVRVILLSAINFRDSCISRQSALMVKQAKNFIDSHYMDAELSLNEVAAQCNLSPSHFSVIFSQEACQTFKKYLTDVRIKKAKELLRTTSLQSSEISYQVGYSDPHYFSHVFRKNTGESPTEFRMHS